MRHAEPSPQPDHAVGTGFGAFISYSGQVNRVLVDRLQNRIEKLAKPWYRPPIIKVFVDKTSLGAGSRLWSRIEKGLSGSSWFILVASPEAAGSWWVDRELQWWLTNRSLDNLILVHSSGTLTWDRDLKDFAADSTAIPACLRGKFDDEPVWESVPRADPGPAIEKAALSIASAVRQMPLHELSSQAFREHRRSLRWAGAAIALLSVLLVAAIGLSVVAVVQSHAAKQRYLQATALRLVTEAEAMLADTQTGTDAQAFKQILAARAIDPSFDVNGALYTAAATRVSTARITEMPGPVYSLAISPDRNTLATGSGDGTIRLFDMESAKRVGATMKRHENSVWSVAFSPDGKLLAAASDDGTVSLWDAHTSDFIDKLGGHKGAVREVAFSADGSRIATASFDRTVGIWDVATRKNIDFLTGHEGDVYAVAFSPDGHTIASGSDDTTVRLWDVNQLRPIGGPLKGHGMRVRSVAFNGDGSRVVSGSRDETVIEWNVEKRQQLGKTMTGPEGSIYDVLYSPDSGRIVGSSRDGKIWVWRAETHEQIGDPLHGHDGVVNAVAFVGDHLLVSCSNDNTLRVWRMGDGQPTPAHTAAVRAVAYGPDGALIATAGEDKAVKLWEVSADKIFSRAELKGNTKAVRSLAFSPDGKRIAAAGDDMTIRIWDIGGGPPVESAKADQHTSKVYSVAFSPDGRFVVSGSDDRSIKRWDSFTGVLAKTFDSKGLNPVMGRVYTVAYSQDNHLVASGGDDKKVRLWNAETGEPIGVPSTTGHVDPVWAVAFSPDGKYIASGGSDNTVRFWNPTTQQPLGEPLNQRDVVWALAISPDGKQLATADGDNFVRLWDINSRRQIGSQLGGHTDAVYSVAFNPKRPQLASVGADQQLRLWPTSAQPENLCARLTTDITQAQWKDWVASDIDYQSVCPRLPQSMGD